MDNDGFFPDKGRSFERAEARRLAREARIERDRKANADRIAAQMTTSGIAGKLREKDAAIDRIVGSLDTKPPRCTRCGDPYAALKDGLCPSCQRDRKLTRDTDDKLSPEELYPDHFPDES